MEIKKLNFDAKDQLGCCEPKKLRKKAIKTAKIKP